LETPRSAATKRPGSPEPILTIDPCRFNVRSAKLAPAMISTPGHRTSKWRQRGVPPAWSLLTPSGPAQHGFLELIDSPGSRGRRGNTDFGPASAISHSCSPLPRRDSPPTCCSAETENCAYRAHPPGFYLRTADFFGGADLLRVALFGGLRASLTALPA